ncbi:ABC transporter, transmembrane region [Nitrobacter winogradskyi Nb-255]|uniref:ABC transporter, transmembrane region n=1 Tax=Nitrobacter winogradskyi (strain ATCC 25391 / DSM 10237 / CIP 104748 / NCIMB 11846 / Nb-255) TaxID=323098 RepID=Q3SV13_NITWN|nr:ATP-binding cassette domain-containing protein [Nitrobacter winogradskyi]ABA03878.1 ABC transporter, transmembrane region [Nitrobacter winogradskyi Nb-255]
MNAWDALVEGRLGSGPRAFWELYREACRAEAGRFAPAIAASLALGLLAVLPPILIAQLIDRAEAGVGAMGLLALGVLAAFAALALLDAGLTWLRHRFTIAAQVRLRARIAPALLITGLRLPLHKLRDNSRATMMRSFDDLDETLGFIAGTMPEFVTAAILAASYAVLLLVVHPLLAVVSLGATALAFVTAAVLARRSRNAFASWILDRDRAFTVIVEAFASLLTIKSMNAHRAIADRFADKLKAENASLAAMRQRIADTEAASRGWLTFVPGIVVVVGVWMVSRGELSIGELVLFLTVSASLSGPVGSMCTHWEAAQRTMAAIARIAELRAAELEDLDADSGRDWSPDAGLSLAGVGHRYAADAAPVLRAVDLALDSGSHIAVTGRSGGGKTTLAHIVARFMQPSEGAVLAGAADAAGIGLTPYRRRVLMLPHETEIFSASIADNVTLWDRSFCLPEVMEALRIAGLGEVVDGLPRRHDTPLSADGEPLSAGQRQRLGIARALIRRPDVLILDEATSSLDPQTEAEVIANVRAVMQGRTLIVITHREELAARFGRRLAVKGGGAAYLPGLEPG